METLSRKVVVNSLEEFCSVANKKDQKVEVPPHSSEAIKKIAEEMDLQELFAASRPINGIKNPCKAIHHFEERKQSVTSL